MAHFKNIINQRFGRLTVIAICDYKKNGNTTWTCKCDCGGKKDIVGFNLKIGGTESCGCLHKESTGLINRTHGKTRTPTHNSWINMKRRCRDPRNNRYHIYGARNISVCASWINSFENFLSDMGERPDNMSIDRIDTNKGYYKENCKWSTAQEQANNTRSNNYITHNGKTLTHSQWSRMLGKNSMLVGRRIRSGWSEDRAVTTPVRRTHHLLLCVNEK